ncbi:hypothetical protein [Actinoplanes sp. GCM10030250]|uniref:hypothetical protein n=1 Tax=Actinoplanes sp. GCM10030250 TaxID=3273376 RepID=UPI0036086B8A
MPKRSVLLLSVPLVALALTGCTSDPKPKAAVDDSVTTIAALGKKAPWDKLVEPCEGGQLVVVQDVALADVSADGTPDAVVARACEGDTEYGPSSVEVFDGKSASTEPRRLGTLLGDVGTDKPYVSSVEYADGAVLIKANGVDEKSDAACPEVVYTYRYTYSGGAFQQAKREQQPDETCGPD